MSQIPKDFIKYTTNMIKTVDMSYEFVNYLEKKVTDMYKRKKEAQKDEYYEQILLKLPEGVRENKEYLSEAIQVLIKGIENAEKVNLKFSFNPEDKFLAGLYEWFCQIIDSPFLLNYEIDPGIVGGVEVVYRGKYIDLSLAGLVDSYFESNRDAVKEILQS